LRDQRLEDAAFSVGAPAALAGHLVTLFRGVRALGSDPRLLVRLLKGAGIGPESWLADVACGKGALAIDAARRLGCRAVGVDICEPFVQEARRSAARRDLSRRVSFECTRIPSWRPGRRFDAVAVIGHGPLPISAMSLRRLVLPGGVLIADDLVAARPGRPLAGTRSPVDPMNRQAQRHGYRVEHVESPKPEDVRASMRRLHARLTVNADRLRRVRPELAKPIAEFLAYLRASEQLIPKSQRPAIWVLRRVG
jgi:SAM-dependent methyltransferase